MASKLKHVVLASGLILVSVLGTLVAGEAVVRLLVNPGDYLRPELSRDPVLGHVVLPGSAGHDEWGFRNRRVPARADVVAIGDSQTYGVSAKGSESWPAQLAGISGLEVYNLALGGYGPMEYDYLLRNRALDLDPKTVVVALYFGNDLMNTFHSVYRRPQWAHLRDERIAPQLDVNEVAAPSFARTSFAGIREWFVSHSVIYRMAAFSFGEFVHRFDVQQLARKNTPNFLVLSGRDGGLITVFTPDTSLYAVNTESPEVQEGIRLTGDVLVGMKQFLDGKGVRFVVILVPSKESVYWPMALELSPQPDATLARVVEQEEIARSTIRARLEQAGICVEDVLPALRAKLHETALYPNNDDGHPNRNGYRVIAEQVAQVLAAGPGCGTR